MNRNRLMTITAIKTTTQAPKWYDTTLAPCRIQNPSQFESNLLFAQQLRNLKRTGPIYLEMINSAQKCFLNGIGTSHAVEILHMALIHPETPTYAVFSSGVLKNILCQQ